MTLEALPHEHEIVLGTNGWFRVENESVLWLQHSVEHRAVLLAVVEGEASHHHERCLVDRVELLLVEINALRDGMLNLALDAVLLLREAEASGCFTFAKRAERSNTDILERLGKEFSVVVLAEGSDEHTRVAEQRKLAGNTECRATRTGDAIACVPRLEVFDDSFTNNRNGRAEHCRVVSSCSECAHAWILTRSDDGMLSRGAHCLKLTITMVFHRHPWPSPRLARPGKANEPYDALPVTAPWLKERSRGEIVTHLAAERPGDVPGKVVVAKTWRVGVTVGALGGLGRRPHPDAGDAAQPRRNRLTPAPEFKRALKSCG